MPDQKERKRNKGQPFAQTDGPDTDDVLPSVETETGLSNPSNRTENGKEKKKMRAIFTPSFFDWLKTWLPIIFTVVIIVEIGFQAAIYVRQARTMNEQRAIMNDQLATMKQQRDDAVYAQRPWVALIESPKVTKDLWFDDDGTPHVEVTFSVRNEGVSPALNFVVNASLYLTDLDRPDLVAKLEAGRRQGELIPECGAQKLKDISILEAKIILPHREMITLPKQWDGRPGESTRKPTKIYLIGCVGYTDTLNVYPELYKDLPLNSPKHATAFVEQYVSSQGEMLEHKGTIPGHFVSVGQSPYR